MNDKTERVYGTVVVEAKNADGGDKIRVEKKLPGHDGPGPKGAGKKTYLVGDNPAARPMSEFEANQLARDIVDGLERREELWARERARGRTPGGSRPKRLGAS